MLLENSFSQVLITVSTFVSFVLLLKGFTLDFWQEPFTQPLPISQRWFTQPKVSSHLYCCSYVIS